MNDRAARVDKAISGEGEAASRSDIASMRSALRAMWPDAALRTSRETGGVGRAVAALGALLYSEPIKRPADTLSRNCALKATWRSGYATVCKTVYPGSIPGVASNNQPQRPKSSPLAAVATGSGTLTGGRSGCRRSGARRLCAGGVRTCCRQIYMLCSKIMVLCGITL